MHTAKIIVIPLPDSFSFDECLWFLDRNYDDCLHKIGNREISKVVVIDQSQFLLRISEKQQELLVEILAGPDDGESVQAIKEYITEWFDLSHDIQPFYDLLASDETFRYMPERFRGLRLIAIPDLFEALCWSIIGQQINLSFAYKLKRRLVEKYGGTITCEDSVYYTFPLPQVLELATVDEFKGMQFSGKKAEYIIELAKRFSNGDLNKEVIKSLPSLAERQKTLLNIRGIGIWTANYALMKSLKERSCIPHGDVGLLNALTTHGVIANRTELEKIKEFFDRYKGWESYLVFYLWRSLA
ncbi:DNA repair protein [Pedobacter sp. HMF7647]|uniref:DNA-3-methyladenine glycosylase II n=1 Tax=Hufsiella arboris TaxID=2695275 RepID=A0A7K1YE62_9SPHI|nr:DNA-3-methyladenine glycosylase 2 family protein [Hufsiella arboris]MXV52862.1 DNA repair protein [Hufsiella arboris]